ncbi:ABC transporter substrate-binding protein [Anaerobium acetethylicum]|uniref:Ribose transport system substrate-binding protein n=1 Tax=Anaerobium acetethylicum TaxID=1619234 RepID=A0A1D3TYE7_9FIRM|nr:ABC transporter substrate-binding protein [Anaerobium acetethylicum]SCP99476.1 ribose transport system substrate-binding protein [Anaerobium acetethylicum]
MKKRIISIIIVVSMIATLVTGCGSGDSTKNATTESTDASEEGFVIGFSNGYWGNTWRAQMVEDFEARCEEYKEDGIIADYMVSNTESDATEQLNQINAMIDAGVDALIIDPVSPTTLTSAVQSALDKGILVVIGSDPAAYEGTYCVCGNDAAFQSILTTWICEKLGGKGNIVSITGEAGVGTDILRQDAAAEILAKYPNIKELASVPGRWSETEAQSVMSTYLSTYDNIDGVLTQDVMAEGILKAFENAGETPSLMTGDTVKSFLTTWSEMDDFDSIGVTYTCGFICTVLDVAVGLLQGEELNESALVANPYDKNLKNTIMLDPTYVVTREGDQDAVWMEGHDLSKAITLDKALEMVADKADTNFLDGWLSREEVAEAYFK